MEQKGNYLKLSWRNLELLGICLLIKDAYLGDAFEVLKVVKQALQGVESVGSV
jgi:hypothetical protein